MQKFDSRTQAQATEMIEVSRQKGLAKPCVLLNL